MWKKEAGVAQKIGQNRDVVYRRGFVIVSSPSILPLMNDHGVLTMKIVAAILALLPLYTFGWTIHADFENGSVGKKAETRVNAFHGAAGGSTYTTDQVMAGNMAARVSITQGETGYGMWGGEFIFPEKVVKGDTVWYLAHTYMPTGFDHYSYGEGNRLKFMRIQTFTSQGNNTGYNDIYFDQKGEKNPFSYIYEGGGFWVDMGGAAEFPKFNSWESYEMAVTFDNVPVSAGGKAEVKIWKNGVLLTHVKNSPTLQYADGYSNRALFFTYWNGGAPKSQYMYVDEITITNETPTRKDAQGNPYLGGLIISRRPKMSSATITE
jgi:hypothetical protein